MFLYVQGLYLTFFVNIFIEKTFFFPLVIANEMSNTNLESGFGLLYTEA